MKANFYLLMAALALGLASCGPKSEKPATTSTTTENTTAVTPEPEVQVALAEANDLVALDGGVLFLYSLASDKKTNYEQETDSVVDLGPIVKGVLYYNADANGRLVLKGLDLNAPNAMPQQLADWDIATHNSEFAMNTYGALALNAEQTQIGLDRDMTYFAGGFYSNLAVYDIASKTVKVYERYRATSDETMPYEDLTDASGFVKAGGNKQDVASRFAVEGAVYYIGNGQKVCLTDKVDPQGCFRFAVDPSEIESYPISIDPKGEKALLGSSMYLGDGEMGFYIVSSLDGQTQMPLCNTDIENTPIWLPDGSLLYMDYEKDPTLFLMAPDWNAKELGPCSDFQMIK